MRKLAETTTLSCVLRAGASYESRCGVVPTVVGLETNTRRARLERGIT